MDIIAKARRYGEEAEISWGMRSGQPIKRGKERPRGSSAKFVEHLERAEKRAKAQVRRKIMSAGLDHLLTLTTRENITEFQDAAEMLQSFIRKVHEYLPEWIYVAVAETQTRGSFHWHIAVKGWQKVDLLRKLWREVCGEGNIDVQGPRGNNGCHQWKNIRLALYLSKYITKNIEESDSGYLVFGRHRYRALLVIEDKVICKVYPVATGENAVAEWLMEIAGRIGFRKVFEDGRAGYTCSWDLR